jgi:UDP-N-acetylmuramoyl-L-alanyl-D-glutamate--2,6-diaminopimelate ligase
MQLFKDLKFRRWRIATLAGLHFYGYPSKKLNIVGITGTNGKTTTATTLYNIATALGYKSGLIGDKLFGWGKISPLVELLS